MREIKWASIKWKYNWNRITGSIVAEYRDTGAMTSQRAQ